jgi:hypothetical protein
MFSEAISSISSRWRRLGLYRFGHFQIGLRQ